MGRLKRRSILGRQIAEILGTGDPFGPTEQHPAVHPGATRSLLLGSMALMTLNPSQVSAIGLGDIVLDSRLGEPLRATVSLKLPQGEILAGDCVTARPRQAGLRVPEKVRVTSPAANTPGSYTVQISTDLPLHEPMYELSLVVECPDVPLLVHHYVLMLELPDLPIQTATIDMGGTAPGVSVEAAGSQNPAALAPASPDPRPDEAPARDPNVVPARILTGTRQAIPAGTRYRVRKGDTLSTIAERIAGRPPDTIWRVAKSIFMTNEHAFVSKNADLIKLGSVIQIPNPLELAAFAKPKSAGAAPAISEPPVTHQSGQSSAPATGSSIESASTKTASNGLATMPSTDRRTTVPAPMPVAPDAARTAPATPNPAVQDPVASSPFADEKTMTAIEPQPEPGAVSELLPTPPGVAPTISENPEAVQNRVPARNNEISPWLAVGTGILLGFSLSLLMLRQRLLEALADLFRRNRRVRKIPIRQRAKSTRSPKTQEVRADALLSEASEFLDTIAEDAFQTNAQYSDYTGILPVNKPVEDTYIVEVQNVSGEPTLQEADGLHASDIAADTEVIDENATAVGDETGGDTGMSDNTMLAHLFDDAYINAGEVIDPSGDISTGLSDDTSSSVAEIIDPTVDDPIQEQPESSDLTPELPIHQQIEPIDPTVAMPRQDQAEVVDPTADMPIRALDTSMLPTVEMPEGATEDAPDHSSQIPMGAFGIDQASLSEALSEELGNIDPDALFQTSDNLDEADDSPTDQNLAHLLAEVEDETVSSDIINDDDRFSNTLGDALSLLDREYEDEFTASQVLEGTAIRKSLDERDAEHPESDDSEETEKKQGNSRAG
jgi:LysM repeat protein